MDKDRSKKYESIDALIMAAEVLEIAEAMSKEQLTLKDNHDISNCCMVLNSSERVSNKCRDTMLYNKNNDEYQFSDGLIETIYYIKDLHTTERWTELFESKHKSDNRILFRELSDLKKKLNQMTGITGKNNRIAAIIKNEEDEDTSTASEDEDYNKYKSANVEENIDDITDDASECEETSNRSLKSRSNILNSTFQRRKSKEVAIETLASMDLLSDNKCNTNSRATVARKRKSSFSSHDSAVATPKLRASAHSNQCDHHGTNVHVHATTHRHIPCDTYATFHNFHCNGPRPSRSSHSSVQYKSLVKVHQPVDT